MARVNFHLKISYTLKFKDMNLREFSILLPLFILVLFMGIAPVYFLDIIHFSTYFLSVVTLH